MSKIKIKTKKEIELIRSAGALAAETLVRAGEMCKPGVNTLEIDEFIGDFTKKHGGISACLGYNGYPRYACISLNNVICHGIPKKETVLKDGDILNIDITTILSGYHGDCSAMFCVGNVSPLAKELVDVAKLCLEEGIQAAEMPKARFSDIGCAIQPIADEQGFSDVEEYCGHGIGRGFHEEPTILHFANSFRTPMIEIGNVFTIEPMINAGKPETKTLKDGWTAVTVDGSLSAQWEHTLALTPNGIDILTLPR